jgi:hypothetical protein
MFRQSFNRGERRCWFFLKKKKQKRRVGVSIFINRRSTATVGQWSLVMACTWYGEMENISLVIVG